jgi:hypothetical protein
VFLCYLSLKKDLQRYEYANAVGFGVRELIESSSAVLYRTCRTPSCTVPVMIKFSQGTLRCFLVSVLLLMAYTGLSAWVFSQTIIVKTSQMTSQDQSLEPLQVLREWKRHHSRQALEGHPHNRSFIVGGYSCPRQVGVQFLDFLNAFQIAVITNRTFLYEYNDFAGWNHRGENTPAICQQLVHRAAWLPEYHEWAHNLQLPPAVETSKSPPKHEMEDKYKRGERLHANLGRHAVLRPTRFYTGAGRPQFYPGQLDATNQYHLAFLQQAYGVSPQHTASTIERLYSEGISFLFGMLWNDVFSFTDELLARVPLQEPHVFSVAVHSRHPNNSDDGSDISLEAMCLDKLLRGQNHCALYLMSDRVKTLEALQAYAPQCQHVMVTRQQPSSPNQTTDLSATRIIPEHGPFAGAGYFEDLATVSQARSAFISGFRSSSLLVDELMEYGRRMEAWQDGTRARKDIQRCNPSREPRLQARRKRRRRRNWVRGGIIITLVVGGIVLGRWMFIK